MTGIFKEPAPHYIRKVNEFKRVAADCSKITGKKYVGGFENEILMTIDELMKDI